MNRILLFSDLHCHKHKRSESRLHDCLEALEWVFKVAGDNNIKNIVFGGDLFQDRSIMDIMSYSLTFKILEKHCAKNFRLWLLLGNHDMWYHDKWDISSIEPFSTINGVTYVKEPCTLEIEGFPVDFLPYTHNSVDHIINLLNKLKKRSGRKTLVGHLAIDGAKLNTLYNTHADVIIEHDGEMTKVGADSFKGWDKVWLGHYHGEQKVGDVIEYIGSPLQLNFGEAFQHKHVVIYDLEDGTTEYVRNNFSPQHFIIPESDIDKYDIKKNFIRIEVPEIDTADLVKLKKEVQKMNPGSLELMPAKIVKQEHIIEDAKSILYKEEEMLERYAEQAATPNLDKKTLVEIGKLICQKTENT